MIFIIYFKICRTMYARDIPRLPSPITRSHFVHELFDIGYLHECSCDTLLTATIIADSYVSFSDPISPYLISLNPLLTSEQVDIITSPLPQKYSVELAHVVLSISAAIFDDNGYNIVDALHIIDNKILYKLQWEICSLNKFNIKTPNIVKALMILNLSFSWDLSKDIALDKSLLYCNPQTLILGITMLGKNIRARKQGQERRLNDLLEILTEEYDIEISDLIKEISKLAQN